MYNIYDILYLSKSFYEKKHGKDHMQLPTPNH